ncbi:retrovirus-related pol polyprotein from transposon TNT 1-94 [Tanacetum coccineum]|uniref:Retrovirus-related pol polyprotein from transposon TNT 1-94 n=1 Tax=Tanacetum coccineum TaxID=301880 RepID=A0ABQ5IUK4_9ASTR
MQLIQKLRDDQKRMKKAFEDVSGRNIATNSRVTPSWREIASLTILVKLASYTNLISLRTLEKEGYTIKLQSGKVKVIYSSRVILSGTRRDNCVYYLDGHEVAGELNASVEEKDSLAHVWHKRLGHICEARLQVLEKQEFSGKKSLGKLDFCENCVLEKSHRVSFYVGRHTIQGVIDYVYSNLWGPSQVESSRGKRNAVFNESVIYKDTLKNSGACIDKSVKELHVEVELQGLNNRTLEEDQTDQEDVDDKDVGGQETDQTSDLTNYQRDGFFEEEQDLGVSKSSSWEKAGELKWLFKIKEGIEGVKKPRYKASKAENGSTKLKKEFDIKELGEAKKILGMEITRDRIRKIMRVSQSGIDNRKSAHVPLGGHFKLSLKDCPVRDCDVERMSKASYANVVGSFNALDDVHEASVVSRYLANSDRGNHVDVTCFVDSDYAKDPDKEAEYMALTEAVKEAIWLRGLLEELGVELNIVVVNCDARFTYCGILFFMRGLSTSMCVITLSEWSWKQRRLKF